MNYTNTFKVTPLLFNIKSVICHILIKFEQNTFVIYSSYNGPLLMMVIRRAVKFLVRHTQVECIWVGNIVPRKVVPGCQQSPISSSIKEGER